MAEPLDVLANRTATVVRREYQPHDVWWEGRDGVLDERTGMLVTELDAVGIAQRRRDPMALYRERRSSSCSGVGGRPRRMCV
jgi:hypothetical protein